MQIITGCWVEFPGLYSRFLIVIYFIYSSAYMSISISQFISPPFRVLVSLVLIFVLCFGIFVLFIFFCWGMCACVYVYVCVYMCVCGWLSVSSLSCSRFIAACIKDQVFSFNRNGVGGPGGMWWRGTRQLRLFLESLSAPWSELLSSPSCQSERLPSSQLQPIRTAPAFLDSCHLRWSPSLLKVHLWSLAPGSQPWGQKAARQDGKYSGITTRFLTPSGPNFSWIKDVKVKWEPKF